MTLDHRYRDDRVLTNWTLGLLWARILVASIAVVSGYFERDLLLDMQSGNFESQAALMEAATRSDSRLRIIGGLQLALFAACGTAILMWIYRACRNVRVKSPQMGITPGASIGWYFVPFANYWMPYTAMREIWLETAVQAGMPASSDRGLLQTWWALFIARSLFGAVVLVATSKAEGIDELISANTSIAWINVSTVALCAVFVVMVHRLRAIQAVAFAPPPEARQPLESIPGEPGQAP